MEYAILKLVHIGALIFWLGPALGAWLVLQAIKNENIGPVTAKVDHVFFLMVTLEHVAFIVLLLTGFSMAFLAGWFTSPWLQQKLLVVGLVIVPLEIVDIFLGNWLAAKASKSVHLGIASAQQRRWLALYHGPFTKLALLTIPVSVVIVMYLAVSKTPLLSL